MSIKDLNANEIQQRCIEHNVTVHSNATNVIGQYNAFPWITCPTVQSPNPPKKERPVLGDEWIFNQDKFDAAWALFEQRGRDGGGTDGAVLNFTEMSIDKAALAWPDDAPPPPAKRSTPPFKFGQALYPGKVYATDPNEAPPLGAKKEALWQGQKVEFEVVQTPYPMSTTGYKTWFASAAGQDLLGIGNTSQPTADDALTVLG